MSVDDDLVPELMETIQDLRDDKELLREEIAHLRADVEKPDPPSNDEIVEGFFEARNVAESTKCPERHTIGYFRDYIDDKHLLEVSTPDALRFANNYGDVEESTMVAYLRRVKKLYDYMMEHVGAGLESH